MASVICGSLIFRNLTDLSIAIILTEIHVDKISFPFQIPIVTFYCDSMESLPLQKKGPSVTKGFDAHSKQIVLYTYHRSGALKLRGGLVRELFVFTAFEYGHCHGNQ